MKLRFIILTITLSLLSTCVYAETRWVLGDDNDIVWNVEPGESHYDHIEMSGKRVSVVLRYGVNSDGGFELNKSLVWPLLRTIPNNTHASLMRRYDWDPLSLITVNGRAFTNEQVKKITLKGILTTESEFDNGRYGRWELKRQYMPSTELPALVEIYKITNRGNRPLSIEIPKSRVSVLTDEKRGVEGSYRIELNIDKEGVFELAVGESLEFSAHIIALNEDDSPIELSAKDERTKRVRLVDGWMNNLVLETPDPVIDRMFAFSKIRASESIYETQGGPMHGPGGESYYAAIWANDQAEYINPYFPFTGYGYGNESALNSFRHFARFMNDEYKPIPSSIIAEGLDIWNGVGDRGDAAMIAYGAARYALARGDREEAEELWPLIVWCLDYCKAKLNEEGVVESDSDELENRFPSGDANLCTSSLYYDALISSSYLARELGKGNGKTLRNQAKELRRNIENYFGSRVEGFDTYAYYKGNDILRSWICIPLSVGIDERAEGTIDALFSPRLWTENGLLTQAGTETFWDRSTLYALRAAYTVGETEKATDFLRQYSTTRLLGDHVPYAIEAWPEGEQRHLSAESGLYGRIVTEGLFGIRPIGFKSFKLTPRLPKEWDRIELKEIAAFGTKFDITVESTPGDKLKVEVINKNETQNFTIKKGSEITIKLK